MSTQLHAAMTSVIAMPYFKNEHARSGGAVHGHEDAVALKLKDHGFVEESKNNYPKLSKALLRKWAETGNDKKLKEVAGNMPNGSYITQPAGSQGFPDVLVRDFDGRFIAMECKSTQSSGTPMWNDSLPKPNSIYIMNSGKYNQTTVFMGRDVITQAQQDLMDEQEREIQLIVEKYASKLSAIDTFKRGFLQKSRRQHFQQGGGNKTNYFTHADRKKCEQNVLNFVK